MDDIMVIFFKAACVIATIFLFIVIGKSIFVSDCCTCGVGNGCCPCPNDDYIDEVVDWSGNHPCGSGCYLMMCENYKKEMNKTFDCFE